MYTNKSSDQLRVKRHGSEIPLFMFATLFSLFIWAFVIFSVFGLIYFLIFALITFLGHIVAINYVRGSGIKVSKVQLPEIFNLLEEKAKRLGFKSIPEVYILQGNGVLNAIATKFIFTNIIVIHSNLLEACSDNQHALSMVIGHELGHLRARHLSYGWLIWPSYIIPFLSNSLSRAREYTADRYGYACTNNKKEALKSLIVLACGKQTADKVSIETFATQIKSINTGFMRLGEWLSTHPSLVRRIRALDSTYFNKIDEKSLSSILKALIIIMIPYLIVITAIVALIAKAV